MSKKRQIALLGAVVLFFGFLYLAGPPRAFEGQEARWKERTIAGRGIDKVAVIEIQGEIVSSAGGLPAGLTSATAAEDLTSQLRQARNDDAVRGVVLRLNTPGGSVVASDEVLAELREVRRSGKPIVAYLGEMAASGGYFVATGADRIIANPSSLTGSIGAIMVLFNLEEAAGKLGVEPVIVKAGRYKDIGSPFRDMGPSERRILQRLIDGAYRRFVSVVARGRGLSLAKVRSIADGRIISGGEARDLRLVDSLGVFDDALDAVQRLAGLEDARVVEYREQQSFVDLLIGMRTRVNPVEEVQRSLGATGPALKYLYTP
ncbi:MAG: signal peptide peptidase SppA [Actinomycetota bacterium]|nr:signal peptide peptidase SppA [Actinomycetota bacterium]